jgi:hypothetical protein
MIEGVRRLFIPIKILSSFQSATATAQDRRTARKTKITLHGLSGRSHVHAPREFFPQDNTPFGIAFV